LSSSLRAVEKQFEGPEKQFGGPEQQCKGVEQQALDQQFKGPE